MAPQRGMVLVTSLLLLLVVTIIAFSMFRSYGLQGRIAGNVREKQRALQAAESAQQYAEWWLSNNASTPAITCSALLNANLSGQGQICTQATLGANYNFANLPWAAGGVPVGVTYTPLSNNASLTMNVTSATDSTNAMGTYASVPTFYITDLGKAATGIGEVYQINSVGYGANTNSVAVVQSTFSVYVSSWSLE
jgi:type IV pilus assembly protein PilX